MKYICGFIVANVKIPIPEEGELSDKEIEDYTEKAWEHLNSIEEIEISDSELWIE